ncbi:Hypoxia induced protein conserved region [Seminavis robusta]|uniref:Hypoxia induced protein conserved region n=1 Tax=Seminavis robusta TaxID=568900 RepID=A0A9N8HEL9_9STRA|nr:Hypoxia induced protein conserved region [Seminavis robusta]|eukprot:Sro522_g159550.1 Hypoxia induced protein conserved region (295) ;mRNA; f:16030-17120
MPSLTPDTRKEEVSNDAMKEGLLNGLFTLIPTTGAMYVAVKQSPWLRRSTNMQARTALCIMPALFVFGFTAEEKVVHRMREIAKENQHSHDSVAWAERRLTKRTGPLAEQQEELNALYRRAVYESGVRVVPGNQLSVHHIAANYVAENPFKVLASLAVPGVAWIFYGRAGQEHLTFSMKVMHTRVFGQFATISMLLGVMGFKEFMDHNGRFITEAQAEARVEEMQDLRDQMLKRLEASNMAQKAYDDAIQQAHKEDVQEGHAVEHKKVHHKKKQHNDNQEVHATSTTMAHSPKA